MMVILQSWRFGWLWFTDNDGDTTIIYNHECSVDYGSLIMMVILQSWRFGWLWVIDNDGDTTVMKVRWMFIDNDGDTTIMKVGLIMVHW